MPILGGIHIALRYPVLTEHVAEVPIEGLITAAIMCVLILEGVRRVRRHGRSPSSRSSFLALALVADQLPGTLTGRPVEIGRLAYYLIWDSTAVLGLPMMIITSIVVCFVMFGQSLFQSGGSGFFTDISHGADGPLRGGPAKIAIVASSLFGTISGSVVANVVSTGVVTIPLMKDAGYRPHVAGAIEAVASTGGQLMPPVMGIAAFIMAEFLEISYAEVAHRRGDPVGAVLRRAVHPGRPRGGEVRHFARAASTSSRRGSRCSRRAGISRCPSSC